VGPCTEEADFTSCSIDAARAQQIADLLAADKKVTKLDLYDNQLGDDGLKAGGVLRMPHSTDVESPPRSPCVRMSIHPEVTR